MTISLDGEKNLGQNTTLIQDKSFGEIRNLMSTSKYNKSIYIKPIDTIKLNGEKLKAIQLKSRTRQDKITLFLPIKYSAQSSSRNN
jgi:tyrosine-protein phosphatase YwqE